MSWISQTLVIAQVLLNLFLMHFIMNNVANEILNRCIIKAISNNVAKSYKETNSILNVSHAVEDSLSKCPGNTPMWYLEISSLIPRYPKRSSAYLVSLYYKHESNKKALFVLNNEICFRRLFQSVWPYTTCNRYLLWIQKKIYEA